MKKFAILFIVRERPSSIAQSVEHAAVNRAVVGSSPTRGVLQKWRNWQTRTVQVRVVAIPCGFDSHLLHQIMIIRTQFQSGTVLDF